MNAHIYEYIKNYCFLEHKLFVLTPVRPVRAGCATGYWLLTLQVFPIFHMLGEEGGLAGFDFPTMHLLPKSA